MMAWEAHYRPGAAHGWNIQSGGKYNTIVSDETKAKIGAKNLGRECKPETREKLRIANTGNPGPTKGIRMAQAQKDAMSKARKGQVCTNLGYKHTEETKVALSIAHTGKKFTPSHKENISKSLIGVKKSAVTKQRMSASRLGKKLKTIECPHCNMVGAVSNMRRYHLEKCKYKS